MASSPTISWQIYGEKAETVTDFIFLVSRIPVVGDCRHKIKIMVSSPITSWQIEAEKVETVTDFIFLGSKITADVDCGHEIKRYLLLGRKAVRNLSSVQSLSRV